MLKNTSLSEGSKLFGLASPIQLVGDTTVVVIADYFDSPVKLILSFQMMPL